MRSFFSLLFSLFLLSAVFGSPKSKSMLSIRKAQPSPVRSCRWPTETPQRPRHSVTNPEGIATFQMVDGRALM